MPVQNGLVVAASYQPEPQAVAAARRFVRDTLLAWLEPGQGTGRGAWSADLIDDAVLLTSELVTNAVVHAGTPVNVLCRLADATLEIAVFDFRPALLVPECSPGGEAPAGRTCGRGLLLSARLASSWGIAYARTCKAVWFRLAVAVPAEAVPADAVPAAADRAAADRAAADRAAAARAAADCAVPAQAPRTPALAVAAQAALSLV